MANEEELIDGAFDADDLESQTAGEEIGEQANLEEELSAEKDRALRLQAEIQNLRSRQARELADLPLLKQRLATTEEDLANWKLKPNELQTKLTSAEAVLADYRQKETAYLEELEELRTFKIKIETT